MKHQAYTDERGFSLMEALVVVMVIAIMSAIAVPLTQTTMLNYRANLAMSQVVSTLREARQLAISKRRNVQVSFVAPNQIQISVAYFPGEVPSSQINLPGQSGGSLIGKVFLNDATNGIANYSQFMLFASEPDTPMGFCGGTCNTPIVLQANGAPTVSVLFTASGALVGSPYAVGSPNNASVGNNSPINAEIFVGIPNHNHTARAITVFGATGRVRTYYLTNSKTWYE
jgi:prepilin-type N-terminal cleavage/methylation domain-containing protein